MKSDRRRAPVWVGSLALIVATGASAPRAAQEEAAPRFVNPVGSSAVSRDVTVATVNGEPITFRALERITKVYQANFSGLQESEAYRRGIDVLVRHKVLLQEARRRGVRVTAREAREYLSSTSELLKQSPEMAHVMEDQQRAMGLSSGQFERELVKATQETLTIERLLASFEAEVPFPAEEDIQAFSAERPSAIVLIPIEFSDVDIARAVFEDFRSLAVEVSPDELAAAFLTAAFDARARAGIDQPLEEGVHQTFYFTDVNEIPDYARDATKHGENHIGLLERKDGSAVAYLVLKWVDAASDEALAEAGEMLQQEQRQSHALDLERRLIEEADIQFFESALPEAAREALADKMNR